MKQINAIIQPHMLNKVEHALHALPHFSGYTLLRATLAASHRIKLTIPWSGIWMSMTKSCCLLSALMSLRHRSWRLSGTMPIPDYRAMDSSGFAMRLK